MSSEDTKPDNKRTDDHDDQNDDQSLIETAAAYVGDSAFVPPEA